MDRFSLRTNTVLVLQNVHTLEFYILHVSHMAIFDNKLKASLLIVFIKIITSEPPGLWAKLFVFVFHSVIHNILH